MLRANSDAAGEGSVCLWSMENLPTARHLIGLAFRAAQDKGKEQWWSMGLPVLKNRLLQVTHGAFKESDYGATTFREFLHKNVDIVSLDDSFPPGNVTYRAANEPTPPTVQKGGRHQVRPDLWEAVLDFRSGRKYYWNPTKAEAAPQDQGEAHLLLPTVSEEEFGKWRQEFVEGLPVNESWQAKLETWKTKGLPTTALPSFLKPQWNRWVKHKITERLRLWFTSNSLSAPNLTVDTNVGSTEDAETKAVRDFVLDMVRRMTKDELMNLQITSRAAMRSAKRLES